MDNLFIEIITLWHVSVDATTAHPDHLLIPLVVSVSVFFMFPLFFVWFAEWVHAFTLLSVPLHFCVDVDACGKTLLRREEKVSMHLALWGSSYLAA